MAATGAPRSPLHAPRSLFRWLWLALAATTLAPPADSQVPTWTRGATCYEIFVRSFYDSDGDGIGDLNGLTQKLDYVQRLGARCIWLMPVAESPSYHGYDVSDYYRVEKDYGTNDDFKRLVAAAHGRGIKVLVDMVLNHTSSEHPWFQAALRDTASPYRAWYRWSQGGPGAPGPWAGSQPWHKSPVRDEWYYGLFWVGMPDLNYVRTPVLDEAKRIARFWMRDMGVDGFRLDAVPYLVEEPGRAQNSPGTHRVLHTYGDYVRSLGGYTVGEVFFPTDTLLSYYPDQLTGYFAFEIADSLIAGVRRGDARGVLAPALRLQQAVRPAERFSPFLRNHDQPRTRTELGGDVAKAKVAALLLLTLPGLPYVYYGEEIGMLGAKPDPRIRTPMQWSASHAAGFTRGTPWERLADDSLAMTVEAQERDSSSLLSLYRRLIHLRASDAALASGTLAPLVASDDAVAAYVRRAGDRVVLVVANLDSTARRGVTLSAATGTLPPGRWAVRALLGNGPAAPLVVRADGSVQGYVPLDTLAPRAGVVLELVRATRRP
ncbi:alpha amylase catalytic region [Gemmatirosa kalamazoonensis]|uniref:Alpha-amylase n=1 Tax=Gemmatirosa kalamazoonensis TaxID=861299 RepID=W0RMW6_9BACT|nr:alpha-amylase family glycosyl hydrolase [Gemmatirosa kalamazoonensis]AHG91665.1 alpha amylase catalytic region [Gemmatirosa kalamazoonensis]